MFGYVVANKKALSEPELTRYRGFYCGLCDTLRRRHGQAGRATLTYDMTFLVMLLTSLYEPDTLSRESACPAHPQKAQLLLTNDAAVYAADMNVALVYYKCMDDWRDDGNVATRAEARLLEKSMRNCREAYPRQTAAMENGLSALGALENQKDVSADACANAFGDILGEIFVWKDDQWADDLRETGAALGRFIYMMDAYDDLERDARKGRFNPLLPIRETPGFEDAVTGMLTMLMGDCMRAFERLPLVEDLSILRNVLYSGVWTRYRAKQAQKAKKKGTQS